MITLETIKRMLFNYAKGGSPRYYEIWVDDVKVVEKTNDPQKFTDYEEYLYDETENVSINVFTSSPVNLHGKVGVKEKAKKLYEQLNRAVKKGKIIKNDKYAVKLNEIWKSLKEFIEDKNRKTLPMNSAELNGLLGMLGAKAEEKMQRSHVAVLISKSFSHYYKQLNTGKQISFKHLRKAFMTSALLEFGEASSALTNHTTINMTNKHYHDKEVTRDQARENFSVFSRKKVKK